MVFNRKINNAHATSVLVSFSYRRFRSFSVKKVVSLDSIEGTKELRWELLPERIGFKRGVGRNHHGRITVRHRGGGHKRRYRPLSWRPMEGDLVQCLGVFYDPNRRGFIASMGACAEVQRQEDMRSLFWMLAPEGMRRGDWVLWKERVNQVSEVERVESNLYQLKGKLAHRLGVDADSFQLFERKALEEFSVDRLVFGLSLNRGENAVGVLARAAGASVEIIAHYPEEGLVEVELPSGLRIKLSGKCYATGGRVSNGALEPLATNRKRKALQKAGDNRHRGKRPTVRGIAMNPVDHPHGGRTNGGRPSVSPWGHLTKGGKKTGRLSRKTSRRGRR